MFGSPSDAERWQKTLLSRHHAGHRIYVDWTMVHRHGGEVVDGVLVVDTAMDWTLDDSDGEIEVWCDNCEKDVTALYDGFEVDYV